MPRIYKKAFHFDLDTKALQENYKKKDWHNAYSDLERFMERNGFEHTQGSGYISKQPLQKKELAKLISKMATELPWLYPSLKDENAFTFTNVVGGKMNAQNELRQAHEANMRNQESLSMLQNQRLQQFLIDYREAKDNGYVFNIEDFIKYETSLLEKYGDEVYISQEAKERALRMSGEDLNLAAVMQLEPELSSDMDNSAVLSAFQPMLAKEQVQQVEEKIEAKETIKDNNKNSQEQVNNYNQEVQRQAQIKEQERQTEQIKKDQQELEEQKNKWKDRAWNAAKIALNVATFVPPLSAVGVPLKAMQIATKAFNLAKATKLATSAAELAPATKAIVAVEKEAVAFANTRKGINVAKEMGKDMAIEETQSQILGNALS
ncbi:hypothetical protein OFO01_07060 [Campylobacter sp. JMF_01 NE2]|uniref:hypothetical protein n=1 Tax=unclassified Campylobacter TaxID=2593542 RepID=UPI0022E9F21B|nr:MULTISPECIES: hypothetical protein [unclassified Campylobacter]MDA3053278.1 hypothetical protein [Campylobacter sp. JMF_03 NE3]MDA3067539.1 hypothetical protein [Campylobacter sp. JMF_01 NE2]